MSIIAVTGLRREAKIVAGNGIVAIVGGGDGEALRERLDRAIQDGARGVISIGIAGALSSSLKIGDVVVASHIIVGDEIFHPDADWSHRLTTLLPQAVFGAIAGSDTPIADADAKAALNQANGSCAVDMESHIAARAAQAHGVPFAALRVISDKAAMSLPPAALVAMRPDGGINMVAILRSVLRQPSQIPSLMKIARDSEKAFAVLLRCRDALGPDLGCPIPAY